MEVLNQVAPEALEAAGSSDNPEESFAAESTQSAIPRRNLADAFDDLYDSAAVAPADRHVVLESVTPLTKSLEEVSKNTSTSNSLISPTGVADLEISSESVGFNGKQTGALVFDATTGDDDDLDESQLPHFTLSSELQRDLSQALINRVSFYGVIHDINKEASSMAGNDFSVFQRIKNREEDDEDQFSPLVAAVSGKTSQPPSRQECTHVETALIDEEKWLLSAIATRGDDETRTVASCPPTFLQAMGEREYEAQHTSLDGRRTQLWKPSRSWWEAKSGKNPWIEPKSHNKRWRYLWPLIHYHKFLAKCIKKLKRNGLDVKTSVSPVSVFLREEVCAVSDHLAAVSLFGSEEWMKCLEKFTGWTDHDHRAEARLRHLISKLKLRPLEEPGDVESPLLRNQIDEQFLRSMVAAREQMTLTSASRHAQVPTQKPPRKSDETAESAESVTSQATRPGLPLHPLNKPPVHPQHRAGKSSPRASRRVSSADSQGSATQANGSGGPLAGPFGYTGWWPNGWAPQYVYGDDGTSVQSALSGDSYPYHYPPQEYGMYPPPYMHSPQGAPTVVEPPVVTEPMHFPGSHEAMFYPRFQDPSLMGPYGWYGPPPMNEASAQYSLPCQMDALQPPSTPGGPQSPMVPPTPMPHTSPSSNIPLSPFWGHLDYTTLAMTGIMTPQGKQHPPVAPAAANAAREGDSEEENSQHTTETDNAVATAQPLYPTLHYNPYGSYVPAEGFVPPSPATQFMMSPQANPRAAAYYAYSYGSNPYHASPRRPVHWRNSPRVSGAAKKDDTLQKVDEGATTPPHAIRKTINEIPSRQSPAAGDATTVKESESASKP